MNLDLLRNRLNKRTKISRNENNKYLHAMQIHIQVVDYVDIEYHPVVMKIGADPNDNRKMTKNEIIERMKENGFRNGPCKIEEFQKHLNNKGKPWK